MTAASCHPGRTHLARGLCASCYQGARARGDIPTRSFATCHSDRPHRARGLCSPCYATWLARGSGAVPLTDYNAARSRLSEERRMSVTGTAARRSSAATRSRRHAHRVMGVPEGEYERLLIVQGGVCAACGMPETRRDPRTGTLIALALDHAHSTGRVRGLLCHACNVALGYAQEDPERLRRLADYVESHARN